MTTTFTPPYSEEAEAATLGALLIRPDMIASIAEFLQPDSFYLRCHQMIYAAMLRLYRAGTPIDNLTVCEDLDAHKQLSDAGGPAAITALITSVDSSWNGEFYARLVERAAIRRRMLGVALKLNALAVDETMTLEDALAGAEREFGTLRSGALSSELDLLQVTDDALDQIERVMDSGTKLVGLPTGLAALDELCLGWQNGELNIWAGRPGMGKTAFMLQGALAMLDAGARVGIFSLETSAGALLRRMWAQVGRVPGTDVSSGMLDVASYQATLQAASRVSEYIKAGLLRIDHTPAVTPDHVRLKSLAWQQRGLDVVMVDHISLMQPAASVGRNASANDRVTSIANGLQALARELDAPVIALSQLSRAVEQRQDKRPMLSDLRDSGTIEQNADKILFLYRDSYYHDTADPHDAELILAKHRNGRTGTVRAYWNGPQMRYEDAQIHRVNLGS